MIEGKDVINELLNYIGVKAPTFANVIEVKYERILSLQNGRTKKISLDLANKICEAYPEINKAYLLKGEGKLLNNAGANINVTHSPNANVAGNDINIERRVVEGVEVDETISKRDLFEVVRHLQHMNDMHLKKLEAQRQLIDDMVAIIIDVVPPEQIKTIYQKINEKIKNL